MMRHSLRRQLRARTLDGLGAVERLRDPSPLERKRVHLLYGHGLGPNDVDRLRDLLTWLSIGHTLISYGEAITRILTGAIDDAYVAFSFDDGFTSCTSIARVIEEFGVSACFFVCPGLVGLGDLREASVAFGSPLVEPTMTWAEIEQLRGAGHEIGSHTMTHRDLGSASADVVTAELGTSREALAKRVGDIVHFAWPFGTFRHVTEAAATAVFAEGFRSCASAVRGCHVEPVADEHELCVRREHVQFDEPIRHIRYLMSRSARRADPSDNHWPTGWSPAPDRHRGS